VTVRQIARSSADSLQRTEILRDVHRVRLQHGQVDHFECAGVGRGQYHGWGYSGIVGLKPTLRNHAPAIAGLQTRKAVLGHGCDQVIADAALLVEEFRGYHRAHQMDGPSWSKAAAAIAVEAGHWLRSARLQFAAEDIVFTLHTPSVAVARTG
jgi:hypothetical protein